MISGDGDMLSIGGNHLIHALRRNVNLKIIMFNNQIYGLTKGQYSPTSEVGKITKSSPFGSLDTPFNPISVALGAEATFVARTHDMDRKHMIETFRRAHEHQGASFVEIYQNCNVFNDGAFEAITGEGSARRHAHRPASTVSRSASVPTASTASCSTSSVSARSSTSPTSARTRLLVHDEHRDDPTLAFALVAPRRPPDDADARSACSATSSGPTYEAEVQRQLVTAAERQGPGDLAALLGSGATWEV